QKPALTHASHDEELPEEEEEIRDFIQHTPTEAAKARMANGVGRFPQISPDDVPHQQEERVPGRGAEVGAVDGDLGRKNRTEERETGLTFQPVVQVLQDDPDDLDDGQDQRAEGQRAGVVPRDGPAGEEREGRHVVGLLEGPVVGGEGARQRHLAQRDDEVGEPEEHEDVEELQHDEVLVVGGLAAVEGEEALGIGAQLGDVAGVEGLERTQETAGQPRATAVVPSLTGSELPEALTSGLQVCPENGHADSLNTL
uniref:Uncharacterized protein n=1 Tax=Geospiza parvula TaxID=87175 RepID=A0A8C3MYM1_GEOPR